MTTDIDKMNLSRGFVNAVIFWAVVLIIALFVTKPAQAADETLLVNVVQSSPYYGKNQKYNKECYELDNGNTRCFLVGETPKYYATTFTNGRQQFTILTVAQFPHDVWFEVIRNCDTGKCKYKSAIMSKYQSPETLAIDEIISREQQKYLNNPRRLY